MLFVLALQARGRAPGATFSPFGTSLQHLTFGPRSQKLLFRDIWFRDCSVLTDLDRRNPGEPAYGARVAAFARRANGMWRLGEVEFGRHRPLRQRQDIVFSRVKNHRSTADS